MNQLFQSSINAAAGPPAIADLLPDNLRVAFISSSWHREIVHKARDALLLEFRQNGFAESRVEQFEVPGAFEIPLFAKRLAQSGRYAAIVACGFIVNGGIYRHEFVASAVIDGLMRVQLESGVPILSAVLTPNEFHDHADHHRFFAEHFVKKGIEVARACLETVTTLAAIGKASAA